MVRPVADLPGAASVTVVEVESLLNEEQLAAVEAEGSVFVSAGAGTGKTSVLVERYVRAVCDRGIDVESILVITYTRKAAGELRTRIRAALRARGRPDLARELDGAWISTIHGFCARLLRAHPFAAGLDPRFRELEDAGAAVLRGEAFERALEAFCADGEPERLRLLATYRAAGLRRMLTGVYETLRSAGRDLELELGERADIASAVSTLRVEADALASDASATETQRGNANEALRVVTDGSLAGEARRPLGVRVVEAGARPRSSPHARAWSKRRSRSWPQRIAISCRSCSSGSEPSTRRRSVASPSWTSRTCSSPRATCSATTRPCARRRSCASGWSWWTSSRTRTGCSASSSTSLHTPTSTEVFTVGDEFQSIYGFRHADLEVFRERRAQASTLLALTRNYRSRPQVLEAVNHLFGNAFGDDYQPLAASAEFADPVFGHPVELLVTDKTSFAETKEHWRAGEARRIAGRVRELVDSGEAEPGEIVVLFAAGTDAEQYEEALRREGLPTYRATGRGYFGQQQVVDLLAYLRLLHNRYDDVALATVLASPFVGVSNDSLVLLRRNAQRRPLFTALERALPEQLDPGDERLLRAFLQRYERLVRASTRIGLEALCERVVSEHDYDLAVLARWDGTRRFANLRKLGRLARDYESVRGADIEGFVRFVRDQDALGAKELEAVAEEEGGGAVRLLTIHAAKGLEFKVVIVADAGRDVGGPRGPDEIVALSDGRFGFRMVHPTRGDRRGVFAWDAVKEAAGDQERAERLRLYYVAMTRAIDRLIVSGAIDPDRTADRSTPIGWVLERLDAYGTVLDVDEAPVELARDDARFVLTVSRHRADDATAQQRRDRRPGRRRERRRAAARALRRAADGPTASRHRAPRARCDPDASRSRRAPSVLQRARALRALLVPLLRRARSRASATRASRRRVEWRSRARGDRDRRCRPSPAGARPARRARSPPRASLDETVRGWYPEVTEDELERVAGLVDAYCASPLAARLASLRGARPERPFTFEHDGVLIRGRLDVLWQEGERALIVDYKSNALEGREPHDIVEAEYRLQRLVYALVCLRAGSSEVEIAYQFLERPDDGRVDDVRTR